MSKSERFQQLVREAAPLALERAQLAQEITLDILTKAFPQSTVQTIAAITVFRPTDNAIEAALGAVRAIQEKGLKPTLIICDERQMQITVASGQILSEKRAPQRKRKSR